MLDVLITLSEHTPPAWVAQCRRSVAEAAAQTGYPVRVYEAIGVPGHVGRAMVQGFDLTSAPYVAWVDNDDYVLPHAFSCLASRFAARPDAICTREIQLGARGQELRIPRRHHLTAWRREVIDGWRDEIADNVAGLTSTRSAQELLRNGRSPQVEDVTEYAYVWRRYRSGGTALRNQVKRVAA
jgi:hypothetical protein